MAQSKLLDSLKVIADGKNDVVYSTHSHHLINPLWLETTFIVSNGEPTGTKIADADFGIEDSDIRVVPYRTFVGKNANKGHYFQPILDRLQFKPSPLEATRKGVFTEGKSDFYILNWYKKYHGKTIDLGFFPIGGAQNGSSLMSLFLGLSLDFVFLLDGDNEGNKAKARYLKELPISEHQIFQLPDFFSASKKVIEDLISKDMKTAIGKRYSVARVTKNTFKERFRRLFQVAMICLTTVKRSQTCPSYALNSNQSYS